jgi:hypothetical protein
MIPYTCRTNGKFKPNSGCPCDPCQALQKRHDIFTFMERATPAGEGGWSDRGWQEVHKWWDKLAAWEKENLPRYTCPIHGRYSDMLPACPRRV